MSDTTLYAVCDKTKDIIPSLVSDEMDNTIPIETKLEVAVKRLAEIKKITNNELSIAKVHITVTEIL